MLNELQHILDGYEILPITKENHMGVMPIYETNQDFFILTEGKEATPTGIIESIIAVPDGFGMEGKNFVGLWKDGKPVAALDLFVGYPNSDCVWVGILLVHGSLKGKSIGTKIMNAIFTATKTAGMKDIMLGVIATNTRGIDFWRKIGFVQTGVSSTTLRGKDLEILIFKHTVRDDAQCD